MRNALLTVVTAGLLAASAGALGPGCSDSSTAGDGGGPGDGGGGACGDVGHGTEAEIAATPRAEPNLELLALSLSDGLTADQAIYERVVRDVGAIREGHPDVADIAYFPPHDGKGLLLTTTSEAADRIEAGDYVAEWDCLNEHYEMQSVMVEPLGMSDAFVLLQLDGLYDLTILAPDYAGLPGVDGAGPNLAGGDGPTICAEIDGETYHYVFDDAGGDCPAGCTTHDYTYFTVAADGTIERVGSWSNDSAEARPDWVDICGP